MRPYDNVDHHYEHGAPQPDAIRIIANLIGFAPPPDGLLYSLRLHAGGTGIDDRLAVHCRVDAPDWPLVVQALRLVPCADADRDPAWRDDLHWLLSADDTDDDDDTNDTDEPIDAASRRFVNAHRLGFQDAADARSDILFTRASDVNTWCVVWRRDGRMNALSVEQG